ncbi:MAG: calcium/proton exchanger [Gemmatimonadetes bacterium]|nr:calcium/proton exchanger [Candidatus Palauibacter australiensis]
MALKLKADQVLLLLLVFVPITLILEYVVHASATTLFLTSAVAIVPLAGIMGKSTEMLAEHVGAGLGGLLNATFGNAAELIIAIFALRAGLHDLVKASLTGSIIGNILLIFGLSALLGGLKFRTQTFNRTAAKLGSTLLLLSAVGLVIPSLLYYLRDGAEAGTAAATGAAAAAGSGSGWLSLEISVVLIVCYVLSLVFALRTHAELYQGTAHAGGETHAGGAAHADSAWSKGKSFAVLVGAAALVGWMSEILVGGAEEAAHSLGMTEVFVGVIVVALVGNAAEHSTAVLVALRNKMDLSIQIAVGSSLQIALLIAPLLVFLSYAIGPEPIDLVFSPLEVVAVAVSVLVVGQIADDGKTHWMEGVLLLAVYILLGLAFFNLPG